MPVAVGVQPEFGRHAYIVQVEVAPGAAGVVTAARAPGYRLTVANGERSTSFTVAELAKAIEVKEIERSGADWIAVNAAGCGAMMKDYGQLLRDDADWSERAARFSARVRDISELLVDKSGKITGVIIGVGGFLVVFILANSFIVAEYSAGVASG